MPKPTGERAALLKAICDEPEDDTPRLVYADWLDEHAESDTDRARAEFIRLQVAEAARHPLESLSQRSWAKGEHELYQAHYQVWNAELPTYTGLFVSTGNSYKGHYERGFLYDVYAKSVRSFLKAAPDLFTRAPITKIRFEVITPRTAGELARSPFLARIRVLDQANGITDAALEGLAGSPHLDNLTTVVFGGREVTAKGLRPFLANPALTRLKKFSGPGGVAALVASPCAAALEDVSLQGNSLGPEVVPDLPALLRLPRLRRLGINGNLTFPKVRGHEVNGVDSDQGVRRCLGSVRRTRPSSSSRPSR